MSEVSSTIRTNVDELVSVTNDLAKVVSEVCEQVKQLKDERADATGEVKDAYNLVIRNKVWILQQLIGSYWRNTLSLELDKPEITADIVEIPTAKHFIDCTENCSNACSGNHS